MLVGAAGVGKTSIMRTLKNSYIDLHGQNVTGYNRIEQTNLNPKSIS